MYNLKIETDLNLSHKQDNTALARLIAGSIKRKKGIPEKELLEGRIYWDQKVFFLDRSSFYQKQSMAIQQNILAHCNDLFMSDFYFLEKSGLAYCAKMILLAETTEIRQIYGLIAADEATHLEWFLPYVPEKFRTHPQSPLMQVLCEIIDECDVNSLYYLVQTIIEGWGVANYAALAKTCQSKGLTDLLNTILQDEMIHHKTGEALFQPERIDVEAEKLIYDRLKAYADVLRSGPQVVVQAVEQMCGKLDEINLENLFDELRSESISSLKLGLFKRLITQPGMERYVARLDEEGFLKPYSSRACAKLHQARVVK